MTKSLSNNYWRVLDAANVAFLKINTTVSLSLALKSIDDVLLRITLFVPMYNWAVKADSKAGTKADIWRSSADENNRQTTWQTLHGVWTLNKSQADDLRLQTTDHQSADEASGESATENANCPRAKLLPTRYLQLGTSANCTQTSYVVSWPSPHRLLLKPIYYNFLSH